MTITEFLLARIAEDEAAAKHAGSFTPWSDTFQRDDYGHLTIQPDRVLAECEAKRRIVALWDEVHDPVDQALDPNPHDPGIEPEDLYETHDGIDVTLVDTFRAMATVYADHPDYDEAWRP